MLNGSIEVQREAIQGTLNETESLTGDLAMKVEIGLTPDIAIGEVKTLEVGQEAYVELAETSTKTKPVFNFGIPKGQDGQNGQNGQDGKDGYTPIKGTDYWTEEEVAEIEGHCDNYIDEIAKNLKNEVIVCATEPQGENRKNIWYQKGKNYVNRKNYTISGSGDRTATLTDKIPLKYNETYFFSEFNDQSGAHFSMSGVERYLDLYDSSDNKLETIELGSNAQVVTKQFTITNENVSYGNLRVWDWAATPARAYPTQVTPQIELGSVGTEIEEYVEPKLYLLHRDVYVEFKGEAGQDGYTPVKGTDYWTEEEQNAMKTYCNEYIDTQIIQAIGGEY